MFICKTYGWIGETGDEQFVNWTTGVNATHIARYGRWCFVKVSVDKLNRLIHPFGVEDSARERIEKALGDFPFRRRRNERRVDCFHSYPDAAVGDASAHDLFDPGSEFFHLQRVQMQSLRRIGVRS